MEFLDAQATRDSLCLLYSSDNRRRLPHTEDQATDARQRDVWHSIVSTYFHSVAN